MTKKVHRPGLRFALVIGSALVGLVLPYAFLLTLFFAWTLYQDLTYDGPEEAPPPQPVPRFYGTAADPEWRQYYEMLCESVAEEAFLKAMLDSHNMKPGDDALVGNGIRLDMQVKVDRYRLDFVANQTYIIEVDGAEWHSSPEAVERDRIRDEYMVSKGYKVLRIPAKVMLNTPKEGLRRVDEYLGRAIPAPAPVQPKTRPTVVRTIFEQMEPQQQLTAKKAAAPEIALVEVVVGDKNGSDLNFDEEVEAFLRELGAKKTTAQKPGDCQGNSA